FANAPVAALAPASPVIEALALDARSVVLAPVAAALIVSVTTIVTRSSGRLARTSRARSSRRAEADQIEPGELTASSLETEALFRYLSSMEGSGGFFAF